MGGNKALAFRRNLQDTFNAVVRMASAFDHVDLARMARTLCHSTQGLQAGTCEGLQSVARPDALKALAFRRGSFTKIHGRERERSSRLPKKGPYLDTTLAPARLWRTGLKGTPRKVP